MRHKYKRQSRKRNEPQCRADIHKRLSDDEDGKSDNQEPSERVRSACRYTQCQQRNRDVQQNQECRPDEAKLLCGNGKYRVPYWLGQVGELFDTLAKAAAKQAVEKFEAGLVSVRDLVAPAAMEMNFSKVLSGISSPERSGSSRYFRSVTSETLSSSGSEQEFSF